MNRFLTFAVACGFALSLTATAGAAEEKKKKKKAPGPDLAAIFAKLDANSDKKVSKDEFNAFHGLVEKKEGKEPKGLVAARGEWFKKLDANNDGSLTVEEFSKAKDAIAASPVKKKKDAK